MNHSSLDNIAKSEHRAKRLAEPLAFGKDECCVYARRKSGPCRSCAKLADQASEYRWLLADFEAVTTSSSHGIDDAMEQPTSKHSPWSDS